MKINMKLLSGKYAVCRFNKGQEIPTWALQSNFFSITKTEDELSIVCNEEDIIEECKCEKGWNIFKVEGPLDFSLIGILSKISSILAEGKVSIFAISTYDTDYILVKEKDLESAISILKADSNFEVIS